MAQKHDMAVFIGRFQPFHLGHLEVIKQGLKQANHVVVLVGSARSPRCHRNPFTFSERKEMIRSSFLGTDRERVIVLPLDDAAYNDAQWVLNVQKQAEQGAWYAGLAGTDPGPIPDGVRVALIGHSKDATSYYLKLFPQWDNIEVPSYTTSEGKILSGTDFRAKFFSNAASWMEGVSMSSLVTEPVEKFLREFQAGQAYRTIRDEYEFVKNYKQQWAAAPYAPMFVTVDAVVVQSGHVLLVRRGAQPGKGLWAMPGGFLNPNERVRDGAIRELREETGIKVPDPVLRGSIIAQDVFDDPNRSARGRTITHAFLIRLRDETALPRVKGMDDADKARWVPISQLRPEDFFEDHYHIIMNMVARI